MAGAFFTLLAVIYSLCWGGLRPTPQQPNPWVLIVPVIIGALWMAFYINWVFRKLPARALGATVPGHNSWVIVGWALYTQLFLPFRAWLRRRHFAWIRLQRIRAGRAFWAAKRPAPKPARDSARTSPEFTGRPPEDLIKLLSSPDLGSRCAAEAALGRSHEEGALIAVHQALLNHREPEEAELLLPILLNIEQNRVRSGLAPASERPLLGLMMRYPTRAIGADAALALGELKSPGALGALRSEALNNPYELLRHHAVVALGKLGRPEAAQALRQIQADDFSPEIREAAAKALRELGEDPI